MILLLKNVDRLERKFLAERGDGKRNREASRGLDFIRVAYPFKEILDGLNGLCYVISSGNGF